MPRNRQPPIDERKIVDVRARLQRWWLVNGRSFFWRAKELDPFHVLVIEILLAKTRAELVDVVGRELLREYGEPARLAAARRRHLEQILFPLGLHRKRARSLIACAKMLMAGNAEGVPRKVEELMRLPSVGRYAASAVACVAFDARTPAVDANVARVYQRVFSLPEPPPRLANAHALWELSARLLPARKVKEFNWAILDLGGTVCTARAPSCSACPLAPACDYPAIASSKRATRLPTLKKGRTRRVEAAQPTAAGSGRSSHATASTGRK